jgi:hypothetical protein
MLCSLVAITFIGCGGITISFNSDDKSTQKEAKQNQNTEDNKDESGATSKTNQGETKEEQKSEDKPNVTVNITNDTPQTQNKKDVIVIRDPIPLDISNGGFIFPNSDYTYLTQNQVANLNNYQLGIARNEIYARHGYIFSLEQFRSYFTAQNWYTPITKNVTLNDIETYNVNLIKAEEDRRGIKWS